MSKNTHITEDNADAFIVTIYAQEMRKLYAKLKIEPFMTYPKTAREIHRLGLITIEPVIDAYLGLMRVMHPDGHYPILNLTRKYGLVTKLLVEGIDTSYAPSNETPSVERANRLLKAGYILEL